MADDKFQQSPGGREPGNPALGPSSDQIMSKPVPRLPVSGAPPQVRTSPKGPGPGDMKDGSREVVETIVFVVVLVLLLKTFLAEAFVIPTGSMATTLLGYHQDVTCERCGYHYLVNASSEGEDKDPYVATKSFCPNCFFLNVLRKPPLPAGELP